MGHVSGPMIGGGGARLRPRKKGAYRNSQQEEYENRDGVLDIVTTSVVL